MFTIKINLLFFKLLTVKNAYIFLGQEKLHIQNLQLWLKNILQKEDENNIIFAISSQGIIRYLLKLIDTKWQYISKHQQMENYKITPGSFCQISLTPSSLDK